MFQVREQAFHPTAVTCAIRRESSESDSSRMARGSRLVP
jgi:hypothetical protein